MTRVRRAMVLAAGRGQRLAPLTDTRPKPLMSVGGAPLLDHVLEFLRAGGIREAVVNLHHLGEQIAAHVGDGARFGLRVRYSRETALMDTGGGIKQAEPLLGDEPFVVVNADSLLELSLPEVLDFHAARGGVATMVLREDPAAAQYGLVEIDDADRIRRIAGRPAVAPDTGGSAAWRGYMFPGLHVVEPEIFRWMDAGVPFGIARFTYPRLIEANRPLFGCVTRGRWLTIDTPAALAAANAEYQRSPFRFPEAGTGGVAPRGIQ